jgi:hypothetical protein
VRLDLREGALGLAQRAVRLLGDLHFWIPLGALALGVGLLRWLG